MSREVRNLLEVMRVRALLRIYGVEKLEVGADKIVFSFHVRTIVDSIKLVQLVESASDKYKLGRNNTLTVYHEQDYFKYTELLFPYIFDILKKLKS